MAQEPGGDYDRASDIDLAVEGGNIDGFSLDVDKFFIQFELGWKVLKEYLKYEGNDVARIGSPREILKEAFTVYEFMDEEIWLSMLKNRNNMAHIYDSHEARNLVDMILKDYIPEFQKMEENLKKRYG